MNGSLRHELKRKSEKGEPDEKAKTTNANHC